MKTNKKFREKERKSNTLDAASQIIVSYKKTKANHTKVWRPIFIDTAARNLESQDLMNIKLQVK